MSWIQTPRRNFLKSSPLSPCGPSGFGQFPGPGSPWWVLGQPGGGRPFGPLEMGLSVVQGLPRVYLIPEFRPRTPLPPKSSPDWVRPGLTAGAGPD